MPGKFHTYLVLYLVILFIVYLVKYEIMCLALRINLKGHSLRDRGSSW
jgi:hypothetical protein